MSYIAKFLKANSAQLITITLSMADAWLLFYHPEWRRFELIALTALAGFGIHIPPMIYSKADIHERLGLPLPTTLPIEAEEVVPTEKVSNEKSDAS